jgi:DNA-binding transcriptional regulator YiaG
MANVAKVLKEEIARISRKETKSAISTIGKSQVNLRKIVADLKKRVVSLEKDNKRLVAVARKQEALSAETPSEETMKTRFSAKGIRSLRSRLRLTQAEFAKLVGTTTHSVYLWERKEGALRLRDRTRDALLSIRGLAAKEASAKLDELKTMPKNAKTLSTRKKR